MSFERPDLPNPDKKRRKKSSGSAEAQPRKERKAPHEVDTTEEKPKLPAGIAELLNRELNRPPETEMAKNIEPSTEKKKKKKQKTVEEAESEADQLGEDGAVNRTREDKKETDKKQEIKSDIDNKDEETEKEKTELSEYDTETTGYVPLDEKNFVRVVNLRLPEVDDSHEPEEVAAQNDYAETAKGSVDSIEEFELAAEAAGVELPHEDYYIEPNGYQIPEINPFAVSDVENLPERPAEVSSRDEIIEVVPPLPADVLAQAYAMAEADGIKTPQEESGYMSDIQENREWQNIKERLSAVENYTNLKMRRRVARRFKKMNLPQERQLKHHESDLQEHNRNLQAIEKRQVTTEKRIERQDQILAAEATKLTVEKSSPEEVQLIHERLEIEIPDEHRLERSAWLSIEVDKKTGRAVEDTIINYGEEYRRERQQEALGAEPQEVAVASGQLAVGGSGSINAMHSLPAPSDTSQGFVDKSKDLYSKIESALPKKSYNTNSAADLALWVALFVVIGAIIIAAKF